MTLSPETLSAFLDDELDPMDRERVRQALDQDDVDLSRDGRRDPAL